MDILLQVIVSGLATGGLYGLIALGFVLIYKSSDVLNFTTGEIMMLGAYMFYTFHSLLQLNFWCSLFLVIIFSVMFGLIVERVCLRPLIGEPVISVIMVTLGLGMVIKSVVELAWGPLTHSYPSFFSGDLIEIGEIILSPLDISSIVLSWVIIVLFLAFFKFTKLGLEMRGTANKQKTALLVST